MIMFIHTPNIAEYKFLATVVWIYCVQVALSYHLEFALRQENSLNDIYPDF